MVAVQAWLTQGTHCYQVEANFVRWRLQGPVTIEDLKLMFDVWDRLGQEHARSFTLLEMSDRVTLSAQARHYMGERSRTVPRDGVTAIVGAGLMLRTLVQLFHNAFRLLGRALPPVYFASTVEEAEAWLATTRERMTAAQPSP